MRLTALATLVGAALATITAPAMAAWHGFISHPLGFAFAAPGMPKVEKGTYSGAVAGQRDTLIYRFDHDNIEYKAVVIDKFSQRVQRTRRALHRSVEADPQRNSPKPVDLHHGDKNYAA